MARFSAACWLMAACLTASCPLQARAQENPEQVAEKVVTLNAAFMVKHHGNRGWEPWFKDTATPLMRKYFTRDFVKQWSCAAATHDNIWDGDFVSGSQSLIGERLLSAYDVESSGSAAKVDIDIEQHVDDGSKPVAHAQFVFHREGNSWKIDDIIDLDAIAYNQTHQDGPRRDESRREILKPYKCK